MLRPNGHLRSDTLKILTFESRDSTQHVYGLEYRYDLGGRRTELRHPAQLAPVVGGVRRDRTFWLYHRQSGALRMVIDPLGYRFEYSYNDRGELSSLLLPRGIEETYTYHDDGTLRMLALEDVAGSLSGTGTATMLRRTELRYGARGKITRAENRYGLADTLTVRYSGLGHLVHSLLVVPGGTDSFGVPSSRTIEEGFAYDALGNLTASAKYTRDARDDGASVQETWACRAQGYAAGTGRLVRDTLYDACTSNIQRADTVLYDPAGNTGFTDYTQIAPDDSSPLENRASYYDALGRLRWADYRTTTHSGSFAPYKRVYEEYRYDALGRRVLVHSHRSCENITGWEREECNLSLIRRTVWEGEREFYEIQMPGSLSDPMLENDTAEVERGPMGLVFDPNPFFGRIAYTYGHGVDRPLSLTRIGYRAIDRTNGDAYTRWEPFTLVPTWNYRGHVDDGYFADPALTRCTEFSGHDCIYAMWPQSASAYGGGPGLPYVFQGTLINQKYDHAGTFYRRNRYYDPASGRFTQEDPIGLAGGLNLYGFAAGDPVNFSDPFGLRACDPPDDPECEGRYQQLANWGAQRGGVVGAVALNAGAALAAVAAIGDALMGGGCDGDVACGGVPGVGLGGGGVSPQVAKTVRVLRGWAKSKGWIRQGGGPEVWGVLDDAGNFSWRLKLKLEGSLRPGLQAGSRVPRFDARLGPGQYVNPFTGAQGGRAIGTHLPLDHIWWP